MIRFRFPPPHEDYAGEVHKVHGWIVFEATNGAPCGRFVVEATDVDMGEPDLTTNVRKAAELLHAARYPSAAFTVHQIQIEDWAVRSLLRDEPGLPEPGRTFSAALVGEFELKGAKVPLTVPVQLRRDQPSSLTMSGSFMLDRLKTTFGIVGPAREDPQADRLLFDFRFALRPDDNMIDRQ